MFQLDKTYLLRSALVSKAPQIKLNGALISIDIQKSPPKDFKFPKQLNWKIHRKRLMQN